MNFEVTLQNFEFYHCSQSKVKVTLILFFGEKVNHSTGGLKKSSNIRGPDVLLSSLTVPPKC